MSDAAETVGHALVRIVRRHGITPAIQRSRCLGLLSDHVAAAPGTAGYVHLLLCAIDARVPMELLGAPANQARRLTIERLANRMAAEQMVSHALGRWAVETWSVAIAAAAIGPLDSVNDGGGPAAARGRRDVFRAVFVLGERAMVRVPVLRRFASDAAGGAASGRGDADLIAIPADAPADALAEAVAAAQDGTRIRVTGGVHELPLVIDRTIHLAADPAASRPVLRVRGDRTALVVRDGNGSLEGFAIVSTAFDAADDVAAVDISAGRFAMRDCTIESEAGIGLRVRGEGTDPSFRDCTFDGRTVAVVFENRARGRLDECVIHGGTGTLGLLIAGEADPVVRLTSIEDCDTAVQVDARGRGLFEQCDIRRSRSQHVLIGGRSAPVFRRCGFRESEGNGLVADRAAAGRFEQCSVDLCGGSGLLIDGRSSPSVRGGHFSRCGGSGVHFVNSSGASLQDCDFHDNLGDDLRIEPHDNPADQPTIVCPSLQLPPHLRTLDPRAFAPRGTVTGIVLLTLIAAASGAATALLCHFLHRSGVAAALIGTAIFAVPPLALLLLIARDPTAPRRALSILLPGFLVLGALTGTMVGFTPANALAAAAIAGVLTALLGLILEGPAVARGLFRRRPAGRAGMQP